MSLFSVFPIFFVLSFLLIAAVFIYTLVRGISTWSKNNASPRLTVPAVVITKRTSCHRHHGAHGGMHHHTYYHVTFQVESGDRMELSVTGPEFGLLAEGDSGRLTFQGTRFLSFERNR